MRRVTITLPTHLEAEIEDYLKAQDPRPSLTALVQTALRHYLAGAPLAEREFVPPSRPFEPFVAECGSGRDDVSSG